MEWPHTNFPPANTIHPWSVESIGRPLSIIVARNIATALSAAWPVANKALYIPFVLIRPVTAVYMMTFNGAAVAGDIDVGIYDHTGQRLVSIGAGVAQAGVNNTQTFNIADTYIGPGIFYMAISLSNVGGALMRADSTAAAEAWSATGMVEEANAHPLPAQATFASLVLDYCPLMALTTRAVI